MVAIFAHLSGTASILPPPIPFMNVLLRGKRQYQECSMQRIWSLQPTIKEHLALLCAHIWHLLKTKSFMVELFVWNAISLWWNLFSLLRFLRVAELLDAFQKNGYWNARPHTPNADKGEPQACSEGFSMFFRTARLITCASLTLIASPAMSNMQPWAIAGGMDHNSS